MRHYVGELRIQDNPQALSLLSSTPPPGVFSYLEYLEACKKADTLRTRKLREERERLKNGFVLQSLLSKTERAFLHGKHEPTPDGYVRYRSPLDLEFAELIDREIKVYIPERARLEHTFIAGSPGRGKTELFKTLIYSYVTQPGQAAVVVLDPHGDYSRQIARWPEFAGKPRLVYFDARLDPDYLPCINPLEVPETAGVWEKRITAQQIASALGEVVGSGEGSAMTVQMEAVLLNAILVLLDYPGATLRDLMRLLHDNDELLTFGRNCHHYEDAARFFQQDFKEKNYGLTKSSLIARLTKVFSSGVFGDLTCGKSTINLEREIERKRVIVFNLGNIGEIEGPAFGRLLMATLQGIARRRENIPEHKRTVTHVFADEIQTLVTPAVATILGQRRKFKMILTMAQPIIGEGMNADLRKVVVGAPNCQIAGFCQPSERSEAAKLVECDPQELATLRKGEFVIRMGEQAPFRFRARSDLLGFRHSMDPDLWKMVKLRQCWTYYRQKGAAEPAAPVAAEPKRPEPPDAGGHDSFDDSAARWE